MKPGLNIKQNKCEVNFNSTYLMKMQLHKIQVCFTICLIESVSNSYLVWIQMHQFYHISWPWHFLLCKSNQRFSSLCYQSTNFLQYLLSSSAYVFCMISYCLNWTLVVKTSSHNHKLFSCMEMMYQENCPHCTPPPASTIFGAHITKNGHGYCRWVIKT